MKRLNNYYNKYFYMKKNNIRGQDSFQRVGIVYFSDNEDPLYVRDYKWVENGNILKIKAEGIVEEYSENEWNNIPAHRIEKLVEERGE